MSEDFNQGPVPSNQPPSLNPVDGTPVAPNPSIAPAPIYANPAPGTQPSPFNNAFQPVSVEKIKNYRIPIILVILLCSLPLGVIGLIYSSKVDKYLKSGDVVQAQKASKTTKMWVIIGVAVGLPLSILYAISKFNQG